MQPRKQKPEEKRGTRRQQHSQKIPIFRVLFLLEGKGLFTSDQVLFTDSRSQPTVRRWAKNKAAFNQAFITAMTKLGRVGVKTGKNGNIRRDCSVFN